MTRPAPQTVFNNQLSRCVAAFCSPLFEIALVLTRLDQVASRIVNANHSIM
jgi:hypothetical protein